MDVSNREDQKRAPLMCPTRARLARRLRAAVSHQSEELARTERIADCASLNEQEAFAAAAEERRRDSEAYLKELRAHRDCHGC